MSKITEYNTAKGILSGLRQMREEFLAGSLNISVSIQSPRSGLMTERSLTKVFKEDAIVTFDKAIEEAKKDLKTAKLAAQEEAKEILKD